ERNSIHALGTTIRFADFSKVLSCARELAQLHRGGKIHSAMLHNLLELHHRAREQEKAKAWIAGGNHLTKKERRSYERGLLWHALLFYQITRNTSGEVRDLLKHEFLSPGHMWKYADFIARYAMLAGSGKEEDQCRI
ncbi:MAG TPA: hypothetical protein VFB79_03655, partial [Candidatus Angelobacter sp.]|nr:hypothetical protein [Candidatus Angelobacter sp.]